VSGGEREKKESVEGSSAEIVNGGGRTIVITLLVSEQTFANKIKKEKRENQAGRLRKKLNRGTRTLLSTRGVILTGFKGTFRFLGGGRKGEEIEGGARQRLRG